MHLQLVLLFQLVVGQIVELRSAPAPHSLTTVSRFFIYAEDAKSQHGPPAGWGLWDPKGLGPAEISIVNAQLAADNESAVHVAAISYDSFWNVLVPFQQAHHFCCTKTDVEHGLCSDESSLLLPDNLMNEMTAIRLSNVAQSLNYPVKTSGVYYVMLINCGGAVRGDLRGLSIGKTSYGYLSGMDVPKIHVYAVLVCSYLVIFGVWGLYLLSYRKQVTVLHFYITCNIIINIVEFTSWYLHLSFTNHNFFTKLLDQRGIPANLDSYPRYHLVNSLSLLLSLCFSTVKNVSTSLLILVTSLGLSITRPRLESVTKIKIAAICVALLVLDYIRQIATYFHVSLDLGVFLLLTCALPITIVYSCGFIWAFFSLNALIEELAARRQTAKLRQMGRFRFILMLAGFAFLCSSLSETYILSLDIRDVWHLEWIFTDAVPNGVYSLILIATAMLWRPNRASKHYSYNLQLPDTDLMDSAVDVDRIRADVRGRSYEVSFQPPANNKAKVVGAWGDIELELEDDDPVLEHKH